MFKKKYLKGLFNINDNIFNDDDKNSFAEISPFVIFKKKNLKKEKKNHGINKINPLNIFSGN